MGLRTEQAGAAAEAWRLLQRLMLSQRGRMGEIAAQLDLAPAQMWALLALEPDTPKPMSELAARLRCDNSNVTGIVDRLEARDLVERRPGEHDRRVKTVAVSRAGVELRDRALALLSRPPEPLASLPEEDARVLRDILRRALDS